MATHSETITVGTTATYLYPTAPVTAGNARATAGFSPPSDVYVGDEDVTTSSGRLVTSSDQFEWEPGKEDWWAVAAGNTDIDVSFAGVDKGEVEAPVNAVRG